MKKFKIVCCKCDSIAEIEVRVSESYRNDTYSEYFVAVCKKCRSEEKIE